MFDHQNDRTTKLCKRLNHPSSNLLTKRSQTPVHPNLGSNIDCPLSKIELLPAELLQQIVWLAHNPLVYLLSKTITSKLFPLQDYEYDLSLLLWCDRHQINDFLEPHVGTEYDDIPLGWNLVADNDFPWKTSVAKRDNPRPYYAQRLQYQRDVFDLDWLTEAKFRATAHLLMDFWLRYQFKVDDFEQDYLTNILPKPHKPNDVSNLQSGHDWVLKPQFPDCKPTFSKTYSQRKKAKALCINQGCIVEIYVIPNGDFYMSDRLFHTLMDNLYIPPYLFDLAECSKDNLFSLMRHCRAINPDQTFYKAITSFSVEHAFQSLKRSIQKRNRLAFARIFGLLINQLDNDDLYYLSRAVQCMLTEEGYPDHIPFGFDYDHPLNGIALVEDSLYDAPDRLTRESVEFIDRMMDVLTRSDNLRQHIALRKISENTRTEDFEQHQVLPF